MSNGEAIDPKGSVPGTFQGEYERGEQGRARTRDRAHQRIRGGGPAAHRRRRHHRRQRPLDPGDDRDDGAERGDPLVRAPPEGKATVGFEVCVKHVAAAAEGARCTAHARLREVADGRKLRFDVEVKEGERTIGVGTHERRVIDVGAVASDAE